MSRPRAFLLGILCGLLAGLLVLVLTAWLGARHLAAWLVVTANPVKADAIIVLGGGDVSRLRKGARLYDQGVASRLVLVDTSQKDWTHMMRKQCDDCALEEKQITIIEGSTSTQTDAELTLVHCQQNSLKSVLVVTSPYHTRRAKLFFDAIYGPIGIRTQIVSTDDYGKLKRPDDEWWRDERTMQTVWVEFGKMLYWELLGAR